MKGLLGILALSAAASAAARAGDPPPGWREDFAAMPRGAEVKGKPGTPAAVFAIAPTNGGESWLSMRADRATASLVMPTETVDLNKTPYLRWRWAVSEFPDGADGRDAKKDDQAIGVYVGSGGMFSKKSVAYRWETDTPAGAEGEARYAAGVLQVRWHALRSRADGTNAFRVEERNVAEDYRKAFGKVPDKIALSVSCNSQYTGTKAAAALDWIEFAAAPSSNAAGTQGSSGASGSGGPAGGDDGFVPLFPADGVPTGWVVRAWNDVARPPAEPTVWRVRDGVLRGGAPRGSWLMSEREYGDFVLEYEFRLGERGNSGCALRAPLRGDPAFDGMELQMADLRYNPQATESELTGSLYRSAAPAKQVYRPTEWNTCSVMLRGARITVTLNGEKIQDLDLGREEKTALRHDGSAAAPLKDRPRRGHIGFQELSRGEGSVEIRHARIRILDDLPAAPAR